MQGCVLPVTQGLLLCWKCGEVLDIQLTESAEHTECFQVSVKSPVKPKACTNGPDSRKTIKYGANIAAYILRPVLQSLFYRA